MLDKLELSKRAVKYILMGLIIAMTMSFIPTCKIPIHEIIMVSMIILMSYSILDTYSPSVQQKD